MILGALLQVNSLTKIERKSISETNKTNAVATNFNYQRRQLEETLYINSLGLMRSFYTRNFLSPTTSNN